MAVRHGSSLGLSLVLVLVLGGCRADDGHCRDLARHVVEVAESEGQGGSTVTLETECKEVRPTRALVDCMLDATTMAEIQSC